MKVLYLTNVPAPYRVDFFNELGRYCDLTVLYERKTAKDRNEKWYRHTSINYKEVYLQGFKIGNESSLAWSVIKYLNKEFDTIIVGGYSTLTGMLAIEVLKYKKIPFYINCDGGFIKSDYKLLYLLKRHFISSATYWLSSSKKTDEYLIHYGAKKNEIFRFNFSSIKASEIVSGTISKNKYKADLGINEDKVILSVGQFIYRKGFDVLIKACREFGENIGVYIIGGEETKEYKDLCQQYQINNIHFINFKDKETLSHYYISADIFVLPTREDIWGLVINEAMAYGLPIITTNKCIAGLELISDEKNGYIVPVNDHDTLTKKILELVNNDKKMKEISKSNLKKIEKYTIERMAIDHINIFNKTN